MTVYIIDGQGGGIGRALAERIKRELPEQAVTAIGSNAMATASMHKGGAGQCATGENAVVFCCSHAEENDIIVGPIGIVLANSMLGEFTPAMACAVAESKAHKILIPSSRCHATVAGVEDKPLAQYIDEAVALIRQGAACREPDPG